MNTVFPLMPWKKLHSRKKKKRQKKNSDFLHIYKKKKPLNLRTREVEQPLMVEWEGTSARPAVPPSFPSHGKQESAALVARAHVGLATRGVGLEPLSSSAAWCPDDPWG